MSRDGNGTYSLPAGNPVVTGATISSTVQNNTMNDVAAALTASIANDGQTTPTADLKMGTFKHKNVGNATSRISPNANYASAADVQDGTITFLTGTAGTNTVTASAPLGLVAYVTGQRFIFSPAVTNTGATTLNINSIAAKNIFSNGQACGGNELIAGQPVEVEYDGTQFNLIAGSSAFVDTYFRIKGSADATKQVRFEADGLTTATTRVITVPNRDLTIGPTLGTPVASTSGTSIDFTGIPSGTRRITIMFCGVSTSGTSDLIVQIGDSGGIETAGYEASAALLPGATITHYSTNFGAFNTMVAIQFVSGKVVLDLENAAAFTWAASGLLERSNAAMTMSAGHKSTSAELDRVRITTANGTDTFDLGEVNISYE